MAKFGSDDAQVINENNTFAKVVLKQLKTLREQGEFCDVELQIGNETFAAHKNVLSACSQYFRAMFSSGLTENTARTFKLHDVEAPIFKLLLDFMYSGDLDVTSENCQDLLVTADILALTQVINSCCDFLRNRLSPSNCIGIFLFADLHSCPDLRTISERFIHTHFLQVIHEDEFKQLPLDKLQIFLQSENLNIDNESQVLSAAMTWLTFDIKRRYHIFDILKYIRFPIITPLYIDQTIEECSDLSLKIALKKYVQDFNSYQKIRKSGLKLKNWKPNHKEPRKSARRTLFIIGGYSREPGDGWCDSKSLTTIEKFDFIKQQWKHVPSMHHARSSHGAVIAGGLVYVFGGENDSLINDSAECFDPSTNKWTLLPSMTVPRCGLGACAVEECIYVLGGWIGSEIGDTMETYEPQSQTWKTCEKVNSLRFGMGVVHYNGFIYVLGGTSDLGQDMKLVESYCVVTQKWNVLPEMHWPRAYVGVTALDDYLYAVGGWDEHKGALKTAERFSIGKNKWEMLPPMGTARAGASVCSVNGLIYVIGGRTCSDEYVAPATLKTTECFDPMTGVWFDLEIDSFVGHCEAVAVVL